MFRGSAWQALLALPIRVSFVVQLHAREVDQDTSRLVLAKMRGFFSCVCRAGAAPRQGVKFWRKAMNSAPFPFKRVGILTAGVGHDWWRSLQTEKVRQFAGILCTVL